MILHRMAKKKPRSNAPRLKKFFKEIKTYSETTINFLESVVPLLSVTLTV